MANLISFEIRALQIPMRVGFKHASAERKVSESIWVEATRGAFTGLGEGCPRSYVTGETLDSTLTWAKAAEAELAQVGDLEDLESFMRNNSESIDKNLSAWCAMELAIFGLACKRGGCERGTTAWSCWDKVFFSVYGCAQRGRSSKV